MDEAGAGGAAPESRKQLTAAEAVNHKRQLAQCGGAGYCGQPNLPALKGRRAVLLRV